MVLTGPYWGLMIVDKGRDQVSILVPKENQRPEIKKKRALCKYRKPLIHSTKIVECRYFKKLRVLTLFSLFQCNYNSWAKGIVQMTKILPHSYLNILKFWCNLVIGGQGWDCTWLCSGLSLSSVARHHYWCGLENHK